MAPSEQRELENLSTRLTRLEADMKEQNVILGEIRDMVMSAKGSWKTVMGIAGFAAALGGVIAKFLPFTVMK
jgi:chromosome condensin MukBEF ATPase and DNA-binding subunit MukB